MKPTSKSPAPGDTSTGQSISTDKLPAAVIDIYVSRRRNIPAARTFLKTTLLAHDKPVEVVTDLAQALETVIEEQLPRAFHNTAQYANNRVECDPGRLKSRLRPMRGLKTDRTASIVIRGHAFIQNLRRGHYELGTEASHQHFRIAEAFDELVDLICQSASPLPVSSRSVSARRNTAASPACKGDPSGIATVDIGRRPTREHHTHRPGCFALALSPVR